MSQSPLPPGWCWSSVGAVSDVDGGLTRNASKRAESTERVPLVSVAAVRFRYIDTNEIGSISLLASDGDRARLERGDLLVVEGNGSKDQIGRVAIWDVDVPNARHQNHLIRVRPEGGVAPQLLLEWLASPGGRERLTRAATSVTGLYNLSLSKVAGIELPLAPLNEQRRIVTKIEALTTRSRTARDALTQVAPLLERFRQSVLAAAFRGDLTAEWRRQYPDVEPASVLLERIRVERRQRRDALGERTTDDPEPLDCSDLPGLPSGWCWAALAQLIDSGPSNGYSPKKGADGKGTPTLRLSATTPGRLVLNEATVQRLYESVPWDSKYWLEPGDILVQRANSPQYLGRTAIYEGSPRKYIYPDLMMRVRVSEPEVGRLVWRYMNSLAGNRYFRDRATGTAGNMPKINGAVLRNLPVPVPPARELEVVLRLLDCLLCSADEQELAAESARGRLDVLDQSILAMAFRGELVPQDPNDEPATVLIERIRAERGTTGDGGTRARRGPRARAREAEPTDAGDEPEDAPHAPRHERQRLDPGRGAARPQARGASPHRGL